MEKIDFFGGAHGHFLELIINLFIYQVEFDSEEIFNNNGACHLPTLNKSYIRPIKCNHYSYKNIPFDKDDLVIEIHCTENDMLIALTNSLLRAGDEVFDLRHLEGSTIAKLSKLEKAGSFLTDLIAEHGARENYPRKTIRNYFYSKFDSAAQGVDMFNTFNHTGKKVQFPFSAFFNLEQLYLQLNQCAFFLNLNFYPTDRTVKIWNQFMERNQGYHSALRCNRAMHYILAGDSMDVSNFTLVEEAWILYRLSRMFRCYDNPLLNIDRFPTDTLEISDIIYQWKRGDYPTRP